MKDGWISIMIDGQKVPDGEYMTVREYAENENKSVETVRNWIKRGQIECYFLNQAWVIPVGVSRKKCKKN